MPYATVDDLPPALQRLPWHAREIFRAAFNAAWQSYADRVPQAQEEIAHRVAWAAVKKRYRKVGDFWIERPAAGHRNVALVAALALITGLLTGARPSLAADPANGAALAQQWCISCHVLPGNPARTAPQGPPAFRDIARDKSPEQLRVFLIKPHGSMPQLSLSRQEIDDLIAYIETLR
jgi:cation transport regulator